MKFPGEDERDVSDDDDGQRPDHTTVQKNNTYIFIIILYHISLPPLLALWLRRSLNGEV